MQLAISTVRTTCAEPGIGRTGAPFDVVFGIIGAASSWPALAQLNHHPSAPAILTTVRPVRCALSLQPLGTADEAVRRPLKFSAGFVVDLPSWLYQVNPDPPHAPPPIRSKRVDVNTVLIIVTRLHHAAIPFPFSQAKS